MKQIVIGIDGNEANVSERVGIGEYAYELLNEFYKHIPEDVTFQIYLKSAPLSHMPKESKNWQYKIFGPQKLWTQIALPARLFLESKKPNVFFSPSHYSPRKSPVPTTMSIMDMAFVKFPELFNTDDLYQLKNWTAYSAKQAAHIFTISNASKNDIIEEYKVEPKRVSVTYLGLRATLAHPMVDFSSFAKEHEIADSYILYVGTLQPRKNVARLIEAYAKIVKENSDIKEDLVIVGKKGWLYEEILEAPRKFDVEGRVKFLHFVSDEELTSLYQHATCFVLPSLYEGFGLPVLEAMVNECPVITSNVSSLPEVGGDAALYVDPENTDDIARKMEKLLCSPDLQKELIKKGKEQVKKFSWEKTAQETLDVLVEVAHAR